MNPRMIRRIAEVITKTCSPETQALLVDNLLGCEAIPQLSDNDVAIGEALFDALISLNPDLPNMAMNIESYPKFRNPGDCH
jgi:hypothetical protein